MNEPEGSTPVLGFWIYLMTDCVLFAGLFAVYAVLRNNTFGGPSGQDLFNLPLVLVETLSLLTSSFTIGLATLAMRRGALKHVIGWLCVTFALGVTFLTIELSEFTRLVRNGDSWHRSGFLSAFFALVGTHGTHISVGLLWMVVLIVQLVRQGLTRGNVRRLTLLSLFWHFLDIIWIFIFTIVYLFGVAT